MAIRLTWLISLRWTACPLQVHGGRSHLRLTIVAASSCGYA